MTVREKRNYEKDWNLKSKGLWFMFNPLILATTYFPYHSE